MVTFSLAHGRLVCCCCALVGAIFEHQYLQGSVQGGLSRGKPGKVREFKTGSGKVRGNVKSQWKVRENVFLHA